MIFPRPHKSMSRDLACYNAIYSWKVVQDGVTYQFLDFS